MVMLNDRVLDNGLSVLTNEVTHLTICNAEPTNFNEAWTTYKLGSKTTPVISAPAARSGGGREVTVSAISDGSISVTGTAGFFALVDNVNSRLLAAKSLAASQAVTALNTFTLTQFKVGIPAAT
jgi:hypothetical protein